MEIAKHVLNTYFDDVPNNLVRHHLDSYNSLIETKLPAFIKGTNPFPLNVGDDRLINIYIGGKDSNKITYSPPIDEDENPLFPHKCRLENETYAIDIRADIEIDYVFTKKTETRVFKDVLIAKIPLMLKSNLCYLSSMSSDELFDADECKFELGGYFIIDGAEKVLLTQESLSDNMFYASKRRKVTGSSQVQQSLVEKESEVKLEGSKGEEYEYVAGCKSISEDGTRGPYSHFLIIPPKNLKPDELKSSIKDLSEYTTNRLALITLYGFTQPVPLLSVFYALGIISDKDVYDTILAGVPDKERSQYDEIFTELLLSHEKFLQQELKKEEDKTIDPNLLVLRKQTRTRSEAGVYINLYENVFPHCAQIKDESTLSFFRRKSYLLGQMTRMAMDIAIGIKEKTDRDHFMFKRLSASGELIFTEFKRIFKDVGKRMTLELDRRAHFEAQTYEGERIVDIIQEERIGYYWKASTFLEELNKSFKGKWGGKDGVAQELSRYSYPGTVAQLRRVNTDVDKSQKVVEMRRIHSSTWGLLCPVDNPDGANIGLIKSLSLLTKISTASLSEKVMEKIQKYTHFTPLSVIYPSSWNPRWTKIYLNSDLVGVIEKDTEEFHKLMVKSRRGGEIENSVSLSWNRLDNEYIIFTDAGRPMRPIYIEGTDERDIIHLKTWKSMLKHMDYIDPSETDSLRISMTPFSENHPSEIHGITMLSANASILPNSDFNPGTRNAFSCQQVKQACGWFNTAFSKRFDTIATWLNYAQSPISQTWTYKKVLGGGCLPYGENPIVAIMVYSGYNQEDSIIMNKSAVERGMFHTTVYHSYDFAEEVTDFGSQQHTKIANVLTDPMYKESVVRKQDYDYSLLDNEGIIREGAIVTDKTILVGIVTPKMNEVGMIVDYRDSSKKPKKGQLGMVDSVYRYINKEGLRAVKIRIAEHRTPVLGDKFSARHGQKGTVGILMNEEDMPYMANGTRPDMIINPHAFPSRMTIGQFIESLSCKLGVHYGYLVDSTPFSADKRVEETSKLLIKAGYHKYGHEVMYNGQTGEMIESEIFLAPTYYIRSKLMVEDKINYRTKGPKKLLTHQPVEGRADDGGLRIGEMERDVLLSHGISKFLNESLMERSDKAEIQYQPETGLIDLKPDQESIKLTAPYSLGLLIHELEAMHISVNLM